MAEQQGHSAPTSPRVVHQTALTSEPETIDIDTGPHDRITGPLALRGKAASGTITSQYRTSRDSQASFDSTTTRTSSIAESVFSTSGLRCMSTFSNSARLSSVRQDSANSEPVSAISPWVTDRSKSGFDPGHRYFCTFCDSSFEAKAAWRAHERAVHSESNGYRCNDCSASCPALASLSSHLQIAHGSELFASAIDLGLRLAERQVWGCGFCSALVDSQTDYLDHVEAHFDQGKERVHWQQQLVVMALLHQPLVRAAWESALCRREATEGAKLRFSWDGQMASTLRSMLECFDSNQGGSPQAIAEFALVHADAKEETSVAGKHPTDGFMFRIAQAGPPRPPTARTRTKGPSAVPVPQTSDRMSTYRHPLSPSSPAHRLHELPVPFDPQHRHPTVPSFLSKQGELWKQGGAIPSAASEVRTRTYLATSPVSSARRFIQDETVEFAQSSVTQIPQSPLGTRAACEQWVMGPEPNFLPSPTVPSSARLISCHTAGQSPANGACDASGLALSSTTPQIARSYRSRPSRSRRPSGDQDDDDDADRYRPSSSQSKQSPKSGKKYACPFRKHDRLKYNLQDRETCASHSWPTVYRLREHLDRYHWGTRCLRCLELFQHKDALDSHKAAENCQEIKGRYPAPDITAEQQRQLKRSQRYSGRGLSQEVKWREVYTILFPGAPIPSPYFEEIEDVKPVTPERLNGIDFQNFMLRELPQMLRQTAEARTGRRIEYNDALVMDSVAAESVDKLFQLWKAFGHSVPPHPSPGSFVPVSFGTFPTLPIGAPIMPLSVPEPRPYVTLHAPTTMDPASTAADNLLASMAPAFPLDMAGLPPRGDDSRLVIQRSTVPPRAQQPGNYQSPFLPWNHQSQSLPGNHQTSIWPRDQQPQFMLDNHHSLLSPGNQQPAFLPTDQQPDIPLVDQQSCFLANEKNFNMPGGCDSGYVHGSESQSQHWQ